MTKSLRRIEMEGLSDAIGFSYALLIGHGRGRYWRVYMGGDENYQLMLPEDIIRLSETLGSNPRTVEQLRDAFSTTSVYLWCVDEDEVIMQTLGKIGSSDNPVMDNINRRMNPKEEEGIVSTNAMKTGEDKSKPFWNRVFDFLIK